MNDEQRKQAIMIALGRGDAALRSADILVEAGQHADAASRAYCAAFHYARALYLTLGREAGSHPELERGIQQSFVRPGKLAPDTAASLSRLHTFRQNADYVAEYVFTDAMARDLVNAARVFINAARGLLKVGHWIDA